VECYTVYVYDIVSEGEDMYTLTERGDPDPEPIRTRIVANGDELVYGEGGDGNVYEATDVDPSNLERCGGDGE
jgi:hypothetical protein